MSGLARKMLSKEILLNPSRLSEVISAVQKSVVVSKDWDLLEFAHQMRNLSGGQIEFHTVPVVQDMYVNGASVLEVDPAQIRAFIDELVPRETEGDPRMDSVPQTVPGAEAYTVHIYNATADPSLGEATRTLLASQGFGGESYAQSDPQNSTVIYHAPGEQAGVDALRTALGVDFAAQADHSWPPERSTCTSAGTSRCPPRPRARKGSPGFSRCGPGVWGIGAQQQSDTGQSAPESGEPGTDEGSEDAEDGPITAGGVPCIY